MSIIIQGQVGEQISLAPGTNQDVRVGANAEIIAQALHGRYYETTYRGHMFSAANQAAQATTVALATTYTGLCLYNPPSSGYNLVLNKVSFCESATPASIATIGLITGFAATGGVTAQTTALTVINNKIGNSKGVGIALSSATIVTPVWLATIWSAWTTTVLPTTPYAWTDCEGLYVIQPGGFIAIGSLTVVTGLGSMFWEEVPI